MAGGRLKEAMADLAETIRRVFQPPASHPVPLGWRVPSANRMFPLGATVLQPFAPCTAEVVREPLLQAGPPTAVPLAWAPSLGGEPGLASWQAGARAWELPLLQAERCARLEAPPLPRRATVRREQVDACTAVARSGWSGWTAPAVRSGHQPLAPPGSYPGLRTALALPVAVAGEDLGKLSKALWMRYTLQLVRSTGENIRNLEVVGLYRIPAKGVRQVNHDPATGRLRVSLGPEALGARRSLFILARRRTDAAVVCCFVEDA